MAHKTALLDLAPWSGIASTTPAHNCGMCSNYRPVTRTDRLLTFFDVERSGTQLLDEVFPTHLAPFIRRAQSQTLGGREVVDGHFGLVPFFKREVAYGRRTYNARSETVATLPTFKGAWARGQRCVAPAEAIFEPNYETGRAVRWCIQQPGEVPLGIAGVYESVRVGEGRLWSFAMLTVDATGHPVFQRMHKPTDEKRMVCILDPAEYDRWLQCSVMEATTFFKRWHGTLDAFPLPLPPRGKARPDGELF